MIIIIITIYIYIDMMYTNIKPITWWWIEHCTWNKSSKHLAKSSPNFPWIFQLQVQQPGWEGPRDHDCAVQNAFWGDLAMEHGWRCGAMDDLPVGSLNAPQTFFEKLEDCENGDVSGEKLSCITGGTINDFGNYLSGLWFGTVFVFFSYIGNNNPNWLIFVQRGVETTNYSLLFTSGSVLECWNTPNDYLSLHHHEPNSVPIDAWTVYHLFEILFPGAAPFSSVLNLKVKIIIITIGLVWLVPGTNMDTKQVPAKQLITWIQTSY